MLAIINRSATLFPRARRIFNFQMIRDSESAYICVRKYAEKKQANNNDNNVHSSIGIKTRATYIITDNEDYNLFGPIKFRKRTIVRPNEWRAIIAVFQALCMCVCVLGSKISRVLLMLANRICVRCMCLYIGIHMDARSEFADISGEKLSRARAERKSLSSIERDRVSLK